MKYTTKHTTFSPSNCTSTGWLVESHATRARLTRRNRWQGSRDGDVYLCDIDNGPLTEERAETLARELSDVFVRDLGSHPARRGWSCGGFRCIDAGAIVR